MKQMIMWVLAATLVCGATAVKAQEFYDFSAVSSSGDTLYYNLDEGVAVVTSPGDFDNEDYWPEGIAQPQGTLVIDGTVEHNGTTFNCTAMDSIVVKSTTPPSIGYNAFRNVPDSCLLVVPCGKLQDYTEAWGTKFSRIVEDCGSGDGIDDLDLPQAHIYVTDGCIVISSEDGSAEISADVYDMSGRRVASLQNAGKTPALPNGIYLVRIGNQTARKVVVKR